MTPLLNRSEVANLLRVSPRSIDRLRCSGKLPAIVIRGRVRFSPADVQALVDSLRTGGR
jgi:excisionase family DNA binding protein